MSKLDLGVKRVGFAFDDYNTPAVAKGIDYKHLKISTLSTQIDAIHYSSISTSGTIKSFKAKETSGLNIQAFKADFSGRKNSFFKIST
jgi:Ni,Fe-hydrogenase III large subunit